MPDRTPHSAELVIAAEQRTALQELGSAAQVGAQALALRAKIILAMFGGKVQHRSGGPLSDHQTNGRGSGVHALWKMA